MADINRRISNQGGAIENVCIYRSSLEDVFMKLTGKSIHNESEKIDAHEEPLNV